MEGRMEIKVEKVQKERKNFDFEPPEVSLPVPSFTTLPVVSASASLDALSSLLL